MKDRIRKLYQDGKLTATGLTNAVLGGDITQEDAVEIMGGLFITPPTEDGPGEVNHAAVEFLRGVKLRQLSADCNRIIVGGCDVELSDGLCGHISLTSEDQINLTNACATVEAGAAGYPYHLDGGLCTVYPAADIAIMARTATAHKLYHTTYYNHLAAWVRRCGTAEEIDAINYGAELPEDLAESMAVILAAAGGGKV